MKLLAVCRSLVMANLNEQILRAWEEWAEETGENAGNPDDFVAWATQRGKLAMAPQDVSKILRKRVTAALRQSTCVNEDGVTYRSKQCAIEFVKGIIPLTQVRRERRQLSRQAPHVNDRSREARRLRSSASRRVQSWRRTPITTSRLKRPRSWSAWSACHPSPMRT